MDTRREFFKKTMISCAACGIPPILKAKGLDEDPSLTKARFYEKLEDLKIKCTLCPRECVVADRERGYCGVRENQNGEYYTLVHSKPCSLCVDPIEKKPLFHFMPGHRSFSMATVGCNIECKFCQNWEISQFTPEQVNSRYTPPSKIASLAKQNRCKSIAYTYTEPVIFYEYMFDCAKAGKKLGVKSAMISNGYIQEKPLNELLPVLDAVKIDLKAFTENFYKKMCSGTLKPVLETLKTLKKNKIWFEIVVLMIPTKNDSEQEIRNLCKWVKDHLDVNTPIHFTRFHPVYKIKNIPTTPQSTLKRAFLIAKEEGLNFPYIGNIPGNDGENTYCPFCHKRVVHRKGFYLYKIEVVKGKCRYCEKPLPGLWD